ncbi:MoaF-related domain-containing protein [Streptomyces adelaidensis]|jgi:hypothetical protein|uniref:MoaF-related domain-containing protein n=1 Tax=Streptomyces adelaidensis TaxID=2796465 RepID=UPI001902D317|nr:hypothetical protein [Streptomyces adelaidensis]
MKLSRTSLVTVPLALALAAGTTAAFAASDGSGGASKSAAVAARDSSGSGVETDAVLPSVGQTWLADYGDNSALGRFAAELTFTSATQMTFVVTEGSLKGETDTVTYTATRIRPGLYMVRWHEPKTGSYVTHVEDYVNHTVVSSAVLGDQSMQMNGSLTRAD